MSAALVALAACGGPARDSGARNVLLITLDTTRADALGCYGARVKCTPSIDALAAESVRYERAYTVAPITLPAHASMLTGLYPPRHTLRDNGLAPLPSAARTLAEVLREAGFQTAACVAATALDSAFALDQGFESYAQPALEAGGAAAYLELSGEQVSAGALSWLAQRDRARPFFLWTHFFDAHTPYTPPPAALARAGGDPYLGEIAATDQAVGDLLDGLRGQELLGETLVVLLADHGEALGEHLEPTHGTLCYQGTVRIPFLVRHPDGRRAGEVSRATVSAADVFPTVLAALGLPAAADLDGVSLFAGDPPAERGVYFESYAGYLNHGWSPLAGWTDGAVKYLASSAPELYDVASDPLESRDLAGTSAADAARARRAIAEINGRPALETSNAGAIPEELLRNLRMLGYGATGGTVEVLPDPLAPSERPSPRERAVELVPMLRANELIGAGRHAEAVPVLRELMAGNPGNAMVLDLLAYALMQTDGFAEAAAVLERRMGLGIPRCDAWTSLGACRERLGDNTGALAAYRQALAIDPRFEPAVDGERRLR